MDKDLRLQVILGAVNKMTAPMKAAQNSNRKLAKAVQATRKEVRALNDQSGRIAGFRKNRQALAELDREMHEARARVKALSAAIRQGSGDTATLTRQQKAAINTARKLKASHADLSATLRREREALQQDGIDTRKLAAAQASLKEKTQQATHALEAQQKRLRISGEAQARYQKVMSQRNSMLIGGGITMAQGTAGLLAMKPMLDAAATYNQHIERFRYQGATDSQIQDAKEFTARNQITGNSQTDMMRLYTEAYTMTRDEHHAKEATVDLAKAATALKLVAAKGLLNPEQAAAFEHYTYALIKTAEMRNEIASPEKLHAFVNDSVQAYVSSQGMVSPADVYEFMKPGGLAAKDIDTKELLFGFSHIMQEMGAERAGNALNSARQNWVYARTKEAYGDRMLELGLTDKVTYSKSGHVKNFDLKNVRKFTSNPIEYLLEDVVPQIEKIKPKWAMDSNGNLDMALAISKLFSNRTASDLFTTIYTQRENIKRQMAAASHAQSMDTVISEGQNGPAGQQLILEARKSDLYRQLGDNIQPLYVAGLSKLNDLLKGLNGFIEKHPKLAHYFIVAAAGLSAMAVAGGALTVAIAGLLGPLAVARYGFSALTGREMPALGSMLKKLNIRAFGRSIMWLIRSPLTLLRGAFIGLSSIVAALGWPVTLVIGALVAGAFMVWKNWDRVKAWFGGFLDELKPAWEAVKNLFAPLTPMFEKIGDKIKAAIKWVEDLLTPTKSTRDELNAAAESGRNFGKAISDGIITAIDKIKELWGWLVDIKNDVLNLGGNAVSWVKEKIGWNSNTDATSTLPTMPVPGLLSSPYAMPFGGFHDTGGTLAAGHWGIVGERGPEIITGPASIASRSRTAELANLAMSLPGMMTGIIQGMLPIQSPETLPLHPHAVFAGSQSPAGRPQHTESHSVLLQPEIHIHAAPTQSPQEIAEMVMRALRKERRREESRRRSTYRDRS
ncbi:TPA: phage tail tape measure protein [Salmonella enterica subsp. enterica serovar Virchow]